MLSSEKLSMNTAQAPCETRKRKQSILHETPGHGAGCNHAVRFAKESIISHLSQEPHWQNNRFIGNLPSQRIEASRDLRT